MNKLRRDWEQFNNGLRYTAGILVLLVMLTVNFEVVMRYFFRAPTMWVVDLNTQALVFIIYLSASWLLLKNRHVSMTSALTRLSVRLQSYIYLVTSALALIYVIVLTWQSWDLAWVAFREHHKFQGGIWLPKFPILVIIPIGAFLLVIQFIINITHHISSLKKR